MTRLLTPKQEDRSTVGEAFSRKAGLYDEFGRDHPNLDRMRSRVRQNVERFLPGEARILELNAGTGADAVYFAGKGHHVLATDIAPGMIEAVRKKINKYGLEDRLEARPISFTELNRLESGPFDHVLSNMGGLNCTPDLNAVARQLPRLVAPGGFVTWVIMPRICPWEWTALLKGDARTAVRRFRRGSVPANVEGVTVPTWYFSPREAISAFSAGFRKVRLENLSLLTPPADHKNFASKHPELYRALAYLDDRLAGAPVLRGWGDFFILTMQRNS